MSAAHRPPLRVKRGGVDADRLEEARTLFAEREGVAFGAEMPRATKPSNIATA